jgi:hypothetical protein
MIKKKERNQNKSKLGLSTPCSSMIPFGMEPSRAVQGWGAGFRIFAYFGFTQIICMPLFLPNR